MSNSRTGSASESRPAMKFRDDIDPENTWIVSDTHFGHDNIVGFCHRPEDHEQVMIAEWRAQVPDDATVLHLGDLSYRGNGRFKHLIAKELTGARKLLIIGNHDKQPYSFYKKSGFQVVRPFALGLEVHAEEPYLRVRGFDDPLGDPADCQHQVSFSHYAWNDAEDGPMSADHIRVHGHIHNNGYSRDAFVPFVRNHINLSVEQTKYRPVNLKLLLDAAILGVYPETTQEQLDDAAGRKAAAKAAGESR
jgi:calcineurin-like phosphoesterase family protein